MLLSSRDGVYVLRVHARQGHLAKIAGFKWHSLAKNAWATKNPWIAVRVVSFADEETKALLRPYALVIQQRYKNSKASETSEEALGVKNGLTLFDYQKSGVNSIVGLRLTGQNVLLADEMGLGKTVQAICAINAFDQEEPLSVLVICPASLKLNWRNEIRKWSFYGEPQLISANTKTIPHAISGYTIINYDLLNKHKEILTSEKWDVLIADESHLIKNPKAKRTRVFKKIKADFVMLITGTPMPNRPEELWTTVDRLWPDEFPHWQWFVTCFCDAKTTRHGMDTTGASNTKTLGRFMRNSGMIRRLKSKVLPQLPPKIRQIIEIPVSDASVIKEEIKAFRQYLGAKSKMKELSHNAKNMSTKEYSERMESLKVTVAVKFSELSLLRYKTAMFKLPSVIAHLKNCDHKVACFAHHREVLEKIHEEIQPSALFYGGMSHEKKEAEVTRFRKDPSCNLFLCSISLAVGFTITESSHVVFAELDWVPSVVKQAEDRTHRIGQMDSVLVQHLVLHGSVDAMMAKRIVSKQKVIDSTMEAE